MTVIRIICACESWFGKKIGSWFVIKLHPPPPPPTHTHTHTLLPPLSFGYIAEPCPYQWINFVDWESFRCFMASRELFVLHPFIFRISSVPSKHVSYTYILILPFPILSHKEYVHWNISKGIISVISYFFSIAFPGHGGFLGGWWLSGLCSCFHWKEQIKQANWKQSVFFLLGRKKRSLLCNWHLDKNGDL